MDIGLLVPTPLSTRGYLIYQALGSVLVNAAINFGFAWPQHGRASIPAFGLTDSVAFDTVLTALLLSGLTVLVGSWFVRRDATRGVVRPLDPAARPDAVLRWVPGGVLLRAIAFTAVFGLLGSLLGIGLLLAFGVQRMTFGQFVGFKLGFAVTLGVLVTPVNALAVVSSLSSRATP